MYVCICNAVTEKDVRGCVAAGATSAKQVRAAFGMQPGCGTCTKRLCALVSQGRTALELAEALETVDVLAAAASSADVHLADLPAPIATEPAITIAREEEVATAA